MMRWPWQAEQRQSSGGDYQVALLRLIEATATGKAADVASTAAVEAAAGALSRAFASAQVVGSGWVQDAVTPHFLAQVGRDLIRSGESLHVIDVDSMGKVLLLPADQWHFEGGGHPDSWTVRATYYGPSSSTTRYLPYAGVVFAKWGSTPGQPYTGLGPLSWASTTARLQSETERSLADESSGPLAQLLAIPADGGEGDDTDPLAMLKSDISSARGAALLLETTAAGYGEGRNAAPQKDWMQNRLGPMPPESMEMIRTGAFNAVLAATGTPPALFTDADGTSQREGLRRWHLNTVLPLAKLLSSELTSKLESEVTLQFDNYPLDLAGRASSFKALVTGGMDPTEALVTTGLLSGDDGAA